MIIDFIWASLQNVWICNMSLFATSKCFVSALLSFNPQNKHLQIRCPDDEGTEDLGCFWGAKASSKGSST